MNEVRPEREFSDAEMQQLREEVARAITEEGISKADAGRQADLHDNTFTAWLRGSYKGDNQRVARAAEIWLQTLAERREMEGYVPPLPAFRMTQTAEQFFAGFLQAKMLPDIVTIFGRPGVGKTFSAREFQLRHSHVWCVTADATCDRLAPLMAKILKLFKAREFGVARQVDRLGDFMVPGGLLIIDEAQHLSVICLELLRSLHDEFGIGVALVGSEDIAAHLRAGKNAMALAQLNSRIGRQIQVVTPNTNDIETLAEAWGLDLKDEALRSYAHRLAEQPGALRAMGKAIRQARMVAAGNGEELRVDHLRKSAVSLRIFNSHEA